MSYNGSIQSTYNQLNKTLRTDVTLVQSIQANNSKECGILVNKGQILQLCINNYISNDLHYGSVSGIGLRTCCKNCWYCTPPCFCTPISLKTESTVNGGEEEEEK